MNPLNLGRAQGVDPCNQKNLRRCRKKIDSLISLNAQIAAQGRKALLDAEGIFTFNAFGETIRMYLPDVAQDVIQGLIATTGSFL